MADARELEATAYHEAGHTVACVELGRSFRHVTIVPDHEQGSLGHIKMGRWRLQFDENSPLTPRLQQALERDIIISLAGPISEEKFTGAYNEVGATGDSQSALDASLFINGGDPEAAGLHLAWLEYKAKRLFIQPAVWVSVQALARELLKTPTISAKRARSIIREALKAAVARRAKEGRWLDLYGEVIPEWSSDESSPGHNLSASVYDGD